LELFLPTAFLRTRILQPLAVIRRLFSPAVNPSDNFDEQKPGNARQSKEEIKEVRHRSPLSVERKRDRAMPVPYDMKRKTAQVRAGLLKISGWQV
jgi:hypothetical protein